MCPALICGLTTQQVLNICIPNKGLSVFVMMVAGFLKAEVISVYLVSSGTTRLSKLRIDFFFSRSYKATLK